MWQFMLRSGRLLLVLCALASAVSGCALPDYLLPRGFSSSYYRHLQHAHYGAPPGATAILAESQPTAP